MVEGCGWTSLRLLCLSRRLSCDIVFVFTLYLPGIALSLFECNVLERVHADNDAVVADGFF